MYVLINDASGAKKLLELSGSVGVREVAITSLVGEGSVKEVNDVRRVSDGRSRENLLAAQQATKTQKHDTKATANNKDLPAKLENELLDKNIFLMNILVFFNMITI